MPYPCSACGRDWRGDCQSENIADFDAIYSGELLSSIRAEYSGSVPDGASWLVITDCPWAAYVEFGTSIVGRKSPHPDTSIVGRFQRIVGGGDEL